VSTAFIDIPALVAGSGGDWPPIAAAIDALYADIDARTARNTAGLELPCRSGCDACCHESVFLTPAEFLYAWDWVQRNLDTDVRDGIVAAGLALYREHRDVIEAFEAPPPAGARDHFALARTLCFRCPFLGAAGECRVHPARELYARLFGVSFNDEGGVYGCEQVGAHLGGKTVTLVSATRAAARLSQLPLTGKRQVYPFYFGALFGSG